MPERISDLEIYRTQFMHELTQTHPEVRGYQDFLRYWKMVESEAQQTEDLGILDDWVRDLARDKERVAALKDRTDTMTADPKSGGVGQLTQILKMVFEILEAIERRLRRLRDERFSALASMLWKGGPGTAAKPPKEDKDKKGGKKEPETGDEEPAAATAKQPEVKRDKEKKMER